MMVRKKKGGRKKKRRGTVHRSGHGDVKYKILGKRQLAELRKTGRTYVTIQGQKKRVTSANLTVYKGKIAVGYYRRSDTKKIALRNYDRDRDIAAGSWRKWSSRRGMEGDRKDGGGI